MKNRQKFKKSCQKTLKNQLSFIRPKLDFEISRNLRPFQQNLFQNLSENVVTLKARFEKDFWIFGNPFINVEFFNKEMGP